MATEPNRSLWASHGALVHTDRVVHLGVPLRIALSMSGGVALWLLAVLVYTRLTAYDPFLFSDSRAVASGTALLHLTLLLGYWSSVLPKVLVSTPAVSAFVASGLVWPLAIVGSCPIAIEDCLRIDLGRHSWWLALVATLLSVPLGIRVIQSGCVAPLARWRAVGGVCFATGISLYVLLPEVRTPSIMLAKVVLTLLVPVGCLLAVATGEREKVGPLRILFVLAAGLGIAVASIR